MGQVLGRFRRLKLTFFSLLGLDPEIIPNWKLIRRTEEEVRGTVGKTVERVIE